MEIPTVHFHAVGRLSQEGQLNSRLALKREADGLERQVSDLVNEAFGLTPDDVRLMWETAPPRMPLGPPAHPQT